jgi:hypothetical protein
MNRHPLSLQQFTAKFAILLVCSCSVLRGLSQQQYYVDAVTGDDSKSGRSPSLAWRSLTNINGRRFNPGDQILLRAGEMWTGSIRPKGSGSSESPIILSSWGNGAKPVVQGNGDDSTILLSEISYWTIRNIAVTNHGPRPDRRNGIMLHVSTSGLVSGIHIVDVDVSDVNGDVESKSSGGIGVYGFSKEGRPARFDDILIDHCTVEHVDGQGIWFELKGSASPRDPRWNEFHNSNIRITGSTIVDTGRNAIFLRYTQGPQIDHNVIRYASARHHGNAVVLVATKDAVIHDNEVSNTGENQGEGENGAFDADDGAVGTIIEDNWSHNNAGGMANVVNDPSKGVPNDGTIIRYNLSENDRARIFGIGGTVTNTLIHNNTIFIGKGLSPHIVEAGRYVEHKPGDPDGLLFFNNIVFSEGGGGYSLQATHVAFDSNCIFGKHVSGERGDKHQVIADPGFDRKLIPIQSWQQMSAYRISSDSACAQPGASNVDRSGRDILGTALSTSAPLLYRGAVAPTGKQ